MSLGQIVLNWDKSFYWQIFHSFHSKCILKWIQKKSAIKTSKNSLCWRWIVLRQVLRTQCFLIKSQVETFWLILTHETKQLKEMSDFLQRFFQIYFRYLWVFLWKIVQTGNRTRTVERQKQAGLFQLVLFFFQPSIGRRISSDTLWTSEVFPLQVDAGRTPPLRTFHFSHSLKETLKITRAAPSRLKPKPEVFFEY